MAYTPADIDAFARLARETYDEAVTRMLRIVADRIARGIDTDGWAEKKLREVQAAVREMREATEQMSLFPARTADEMDAAYRAGVQEGADALQRAALDDIRAGLAEVQQAGFRTLVKATVTKLEAVPVQILRAAHDEYRNVVARASALELTGTITRRQAAQQVLDQFADKGIQTFVDSAGRSWDVASYAEMAVRTGVGNAQSQGRLDKFTDAGKDLVIVTDSPEECELCRPWEGKVLSISGQTEGYPTVQSAIDAGLKHANCTHTFALYTPGLTRAPAETENPEGYEERQRQRQLERNIRHWKRREAVAITDEAKARAKGKVRVWQGEMRQFVEETGRLRQRQREGISAAR